MDALILAAGMGSRLRSLFNSKPLATICGLPLIEIAIRQAAAAGCRQVVVVTGYRADEVEAVLPAIAEMAGVRVSAQRVDDWSKPNGYSVLAGAAKLPGDYFLMMADHIFSAPILQKLAHVAGSDRDVTLAIDRRTEGPHIDPDDATWVGTSVDGFIQAIGKHIDRREAVDCGAFLATPRLAEAIEAAIVAGYPGSLSDGMQVLADRGRAATVDIGDAWWLDVDDPRAHALAEAEVAGQLPEIFGAADAGLRQLHTMHG